MIASLFLKAGKHREPWLMRQIMPRYTWLLKRALDRPIYVYGAAGLGIVAAVGAYFAVGKTFMPTMDEGAIIMQTAKLPSVDLKRTIKVDLAVEKAIIKQVPEVLNMVSRVGSDELGLDPMGLNESDMFMVLKPKDQWTVPTKEAILDEIRAVMKDFPGDRLRFHPADRNAHLGNAHRQPRRSRDQDLRSRSQGARRASAANPGDRLKGARRVRGIHRRQ